MFCYEGNAFDTFVIPQGYMQCVLVSFVHKNTTLHCTTHTVYVTKIKEHERKDSLYDMRCASFKMVHFKLTLLNIY